MEKNLWLFYTTRKKELSNKITISYGYCHRVNCKNTELITT
jgi:hypothetical protein